MAKDFEKLGVFDLNQADVIQGALSAENIQFMVSDGSVVGFPSVLIMVDSKDKKKAEQIVEDLL